MGLLRVPGVARVAVPGALLSLLGHHAVTTRRGAAGTGYAHVFPESGVDKVRDAPPGVPVLIVARVRWGGLRGEHAQPVSCGGTSGQHANCQQGDPKECTAKEGHGAECVEKSYKGKENSTQTTTSQMHSSG
ncbi:hypothetical protein XENOCAPTIV_016603 [Xenoophorus captivus]|uniref:Secreted protein n=1 Tax=Xenoophorus captivus TaxID=1517983 RepID=A0ABV0RQV7_9TELE